MTLIELFMAFIGLIGAIGAFQGALSHGWYWAVLALPLGLVLGVVGVLPFVVLTGLAAFALSPIEESLRKRLPYLHEAFETAAAIFLFIWGVAAAWTIYALIHAGIDRLLGWMGF